jgi:hypothetical protein
MTHLRTLAAALLALALPAAASAADLAYDPPAAPLSIAPGDGRFWIAGTFDGTETADFALDVAAGGKRLRVAYDTPSREDGFTIELIDPQGEVAVRESGTNAFNAEAFLLAPDGETIAPGRWIVRLTSASSATQASARLRAKLERLVPQAAANADGSPRALLPNLKAVPPYEFGFVAPANPLNGAYPPDTVNPPLSVAGQEPLSCAADEMAPPEAGGAGAKVCLRLTTGPINVGEGPFVKTFHFADELAGGAVDVETLRGKANQVVYASDGTTSLVPAGTYSFHTTHAHFHDDGILTYELFRVTGQTLTPAGTGTKSGFCPADQLMGEWRSFSQQAPGFFGEGDTSTGSCMSPQDGMLALTSGWGDVYRWQRPGQYVEFDGNGDGHYVVRTTVDKSNTTLETNDADNSAYALIRIRGRQVELVERGQGTSHLDPVKVVFTGLGPAGQDPYGELPPAAAPAEVPAPQVSAVRRRGALLVFRVSRATRVRVVVYGAEGRVLRRFAVRARRGVNRVRLPHGARRAVVRV